MSKELDTAFIVATTMNPLPMRFKEAIRLLQASKQKRHHKAAERLMTMMKHPLTRHHYDSLIIDSAERLILREFVPPPLGQRPEWRDLDQYTGPVLQTVLETVRRRKAVIHQQRPEARLLIYAVSISGGREIMACIE